MKLIKLLSVVICALALAAGPVLGAEEAKKKQSCCEKAKAKGEDCKHPCCVDAKKEGKSCEKCNPKTEKKEEKK
jgi:hypothetical protein